MVNRLNHKLILKKMMRLMLSGMFILVMIVSFSVLTSAEAIGVSQTSIEVKGDIQPHLPLTGTENSESDEKDIELVSRHQNRLPELGDSQNDCHLLIGIFLVSLVGLLCWCELSKYSIKNNH